MHDDYPDGYFEEFERAQTVLVDRCKRECPEIIYVSKLRSPVEQDDEEDLWGEIGDTATSGRSQIPDGDTEEDLWGGDIEVPSQQPTGACRLSAYVASELTEDQAEKLGLKKALDLVVAFPVRYLEEKELIVQVGDSFSVFDIDYEVREVHRWGYWKESSVFVCLVLNCTTKKES